MHRSADEWRAEGNSHYDAQRWDDAARAFESELESDPACMESWYKLGNVYQEQGNEQRAMECFEKATVLDPKYAKAWNNLGVSREKLGHEARAAEAYSLAVEKDPSLLQALLNLAHVTLRLGDEEGAVRLLEQATSLDPSNAGTWDTLARAHLKLGRTEAANKAYRTAMELLSPRVLPHIKEAELALVRSDYVAAEASLRAALEYLPDHPSLRHMLAAVRGETTDRASAAYVTVLFDEFAQRYDKWMLENLRYCAPTLLAGAIAPMLLGPSPAEIVDLGCGTGLLGGALAHLKANIVGIDLSEKMLEKATQRGVYARLVKGDLVEELERIRSASVDAVLAADVFIYLGNLQPVFSAAARTLVPGGVFAFTVEALEKGEFEITPTGRYAHTSDYVRRLAAQSRFSEARMERIRGRRERDGYVECWLACFVAPGPGQPKHGDTA